MHVERTPIDGLLIIAPTVHADHRGFFFESYNEVRFRELGIDLDWRQDNHAKSTKNTVRGLHFQRGEGQAKLVRCVRGCVWDVAVDIRRGSSSFGRWVGENLSAENGRQIFIPAGFAHGFCVLSDTADVLYKCSAFYDPDDEYGIMWSDPGIGIQWPIEEPVVSEKDSAYPCLAEIPEDHLPT